MDQIKSGKRIVDGRDKNGKDGRLASICKNYYFFNGHLL